MAGTVKGCVGSKRPAIHFGIEVPLTRELSIASVTDATPDRRA
jgi:hypothetical protein